MIRKITLTILLLFIAIFPNKSMAKIDMDNNSEYVTLRKKYDDTRKKRSMYVDLVSYYNIEENTKKADKTRHKIYNIDLELEDLKNDLRKYNYDFSKDEEKPSYRKKDILELEPNYKSVNSRLRIKMGKKILVVMLTGYLIINIITKLIRKRIIKI